MLERTTGVKVTNRNEIVVGLDETASSGAALRWAANQARITGSTIRAVHVLDWAVGVIAFDTVDANREGVIPESQVSPPYRRGIRSVFEEVDPETNWGLEFAEGETGPQLVRFAKDAAMLVIGGRLGAGFTNDSSGFVGHYCLSHLACPLVVITDDTQQAADSTRHLYALPGKLPT
jgi:nucleotide-binding universal stress UspA family protein